MQHKSDKERIAPRLNAVCGDDLCNRRILKSSCLGNLRNRGYYPSNKKEPLLTLAS